MREAFKLLHEYQFLNMFMNDRNHWALVSLIIIQTSLTKKAKSWLYMSVLSTIIDHHLSDITGEGSFRIKLPPVLFFKIWLNYYYSKPLKADSLDLRQSF